MKKVIIEILKNMWIVINEPFRILNDFKDNHGV